MYGKVGSTSLRKDEKNGKGEYIEFERESYDADIIQTHSPAVAKSVLQTKEKILVLIFQKSMLSKRIRLNLI